LNARFKEFNQSLKWDNLRMGLPQPIHKMTAQEFSVWELDEPERHEFFRGEVYRVFGMGGARREHNDVSGNCYLALRNHLSGTSFRAYTNDMKVHVKGTGDMFYPDVLVTCHPRDLAASLEMQHPKLIIEVLSPSTATFDRGDKFLTYRQIPELEEYALVDPHAKTFEVYRRQPNVTDWLLAPGRYADGLLLHSVDLVVPSDLLFENV
jgi:Uma2 family endonuclease